MSCLQFSCRNESRNLSFSSAFILFSLRSTDHPGSPKIILCVEIFLSVALTCPWPVFPRISPVPVRVHSLERTQAFALFTSLPPPPPPLPHST